MIDASSVVGPRTGIGHYTAQLLGALGRQWPEDWPPARLLVNSPRHDLPPDDPWIGRDCFQIVRRRIPGRLLLRAWQYLHWPPIEQLAGGVADVVHAPASYIPPVRRARRIVTVHDLYFHRATDDVEPYGGKYFLQTFAHGLPRMDRIVAVSQFTRDEAVRTYGIDPDRIAVIHHGVDRERFHARPMDEDVGQVAALGVQAPYLLCVATLEPRKNLPSLIDAYGRLRQMPRGSGTESPRLVIAGARAQAAEALERQVDAAGLRDAVVLTGYVPDATLPALYRQAAGFVLPSLEEGFGMPALEAMACGCPMALARVGALPEVADDAALLFDPRDIEAMVRALHRLLTESDLRERLRVAGLRRAAQYTWSAAARATLEVYRDVFLSRNC